MKEVFRFSINLTCDIVTIYRTIICLVLARHPITKYKIQISFDTSESFEIFNLLYCDNIKRRNHYHEYDISEIRTVYIHQYIPMDFQFTGIYHLFI